MDSKNTLNKLLNDVYLLKCLLFFVIIYLVITTFSIIFEFSFDSLLFKICLYIPMLLFFIISLDYPFDTVKKDCGALFKITDFKRVLFIILANFLFTAVIFFILNYISIFGFFRFDSHLFGYLNLDDPSYVLIYFLAVIILSPIVEELLFRRVILTSLISDYNFNIPLAILVSSILFGLCHNFGGILSSFVFGICMSILYLKTKNILVPVFVHMFNNLISFILSFTNIEFFIMSNEIIILLIVSLFIVTNFILFKDIFKEISNLT